jgi:hypothetical protein
MQTIRLKTIIGNWVIHPIGCLSYTIGHGHSCTVHGMNGAIYHCAMSIRQIMDNYPGIGLKMISEVKLLNMRDVLKVKPFSIKLFTMVSDGSIHRSSDGYIIFFNSLKFKKLSDFWR